MNPWTALPSSAPFVLPDDVVEIERFNAKARLDHAVHLELIPEPFLGNPTAPVVLLNLNPGFAEGDRQVHLDPAFRAAAVANLTHRHPEYPLYLLDPAIPSLGQDWWMRKMRVLVEQAGLRAVASNVLVVEFHGYHSRKFAPIRRLSSQKYSRQLVFDAIAREAILIVMRGWEEWKSLVPELSVVTSVAFVRSVQNPSISPRNLPDAFDRIIAAVTKDH